MKLERIFSLSWALFPLLLFATFDTLHASTLTPFSPRRIQEFIQEKCGTTGSAVWVYEGALYDPLDGHKIANVEGLELVRTLSESPETKSRSAKLQAHGIKGDYSSTVLSRRLFCYASPNSPRKLLDSIRLRPNAPRRSIPTNQAVALYDSATTYISRNGGKQLLLHTEWPNGKSTWGTATCSLSPPQQNDKKKSTTKKSLDFSVFSRPSNTPVPDATETTNSSEEQVVVTPKRSQWIQFGTSSQQQPDQSKFGARETYSYTLDETPAKGRNWLDRFFKRRTQDASTITSEVKYTRYGEGPPWYGPGKYCMLELTGRKVSSVEEAPPLAASVAASQVPGFLSVDTPISSDASAEGAVEWFQRGNLQLLDEEGEEASGARRLPKGGLARAAFKVKSQAARALNKIRAASTLEANYNTN